MARGTCYGTCTLYKSEEKKLRIKNLHDVIKSTLVRPKTHSTGILSITLVKVFAMHATSMLSTTITAIKL